MSIFIRGIEFNIIRKIYLADTSCITIRLTVPTENYGSATHGTAWITHSSRLIIFSINISLLFAYEVSSKACSKQYINQKVKTYEIQPKCSFSELITFLKSKSPDSQTWMIDSKVESDNILYLCNKIKDRYGGPALEVKKNFPDLLTPGMFPYYKETVPLKEFTGVDIILWPFLQKTDDNDILDRYELYEKKTKIIEYPLNINDVEKYLLLNEYKVRLTKDDKIVRDPLGDNVIVINDTGSGYEFIR